MPEATRSTQGGLTIEQWVLAADPREFVSKSSGQPMTVLELRDPARLGNSVVLFLDGPVGSLAGGSPRTPITLHLEEVRSGRGRGELIGRAAREVVEKSLRPERS